MTKMTTRQHFDPSRIRYLCNSILLVHLVGAATVTADAVAGDDDDSSIDCDVFAMAMVATRTLTTKMKTTTMSLNLWHLANMNKCSLNTVVMYNYVMELVWLHREEEERNKYIRNE